jgi:hypothetical protein
LNQITLGIINKVLVGGALIVPVLATSRYYTDRSGAFAELQPYFPLWRSVQVDEGLLVVIAVEHDGVSRSVPRIRGGTDGRASQ